MKPIATENVLINGHRISYGIYGEGEPVVLIHGTPSSSLIWRNVLPKLASGGYKVHVYDLLGYGVSERPWDLAVDTSMSGQVPILEGLLRHWGFDDKEEGKQKEGRNGVHIVAHDIGGGVAQRFSIFSPARVRSLTMIDVVSFDSYPSARTKQQMQSGLEKLIKAEDGAHRAHFRDWLLSTVHNPRKFATGGTTNASGDGSSSGSGSLDVFLEYISGPVGQASFFQHQVRHYDPKHTMEVADRYHELENLPVQLIWGKNDAWQVTDWADRLNKAIPGSELSILDDCGHFSPEDQPEKISELLLAFLKKHS